MEATSTQQHQEMGTLENMLICPKPNQTDQERKPRPQQDQALKCPRCDSTNTKFCYYNNYSLSQPRYFCKSCRRYWTKGGTLRNVPVGGGCRKNKRSSSSSNASKIKTTTTATQLDQLDNQDQFGSNTLHNLTYDSNDLNLAFARLQKQTNGQLEHGNLSYLTNPNHIPSFLDTQNPNFFYGSYGNTMGEVDNNGGAYNLGGEMVINPYQDMNETKMDCHDRRGSTMSSWSGAIKQEEGTNNKVLWGYPWQFSGNGNLSTSGNDNLDSTRESWINGFGGSNWHGLLNSPLM